MAFCAIIDRHRPDLLNYDDCDPDTPLVNLETAMSVAEEKLGIVRLIDPEGECVSLCVCVCEGGREGGRGEGGRERGNTYVSMEIKKSDYYVHVYTY